MVLALLALPLSAQDGPSASGAAAAYITELRAESRNNLVRLTWVDSPGLRGPVYIFRSALPFGLDNPHDRIRPIEVPYGVQSYIDEVEESGTWYYFISASRPPGARNDLFLPQINAISVEVEAPDNGSLARREAERIPEAPSPGGIYDLEAALRGDGVEIRFRHSGEALVLFRSAAPIRRQADLDNAVIIAGGPVSPYTDYPVPGIPYYYALVPEADFLGGGRLEISPGRNATTEPVEIPSGARVGLRNSPELRSMPLPLIAVSAVSPLGSAVEPVSLSPAALAAQAPYAPGGEGRRVYKSPRAFRQDLNEAPGGGEDYSLGIIVRGSFLARDWEEARDELDHYLSLPRSPAAAARARFYRGQACYYSGEFREALFDFLLVEDSYPAEAGEWIQAALSMLIK
ncbi:MAG: hypothetical protein LBQ35_05130 [Spirochaetaceae bacterium]|jgi:hypothetical protein|nr:hypothetical protein [Spirochaetaceae bacterium]